jgi:hypothetical protein
MKIGQRLKNIVGTVAPKLGVALGGPLGGMAGKMLQTALGVDSEEAALQMLESDPDALLKIKQAEQDFETRMRELDIDESRLDVEDRSSAREREKIVRDRTPAYLAYLLTAGFFGVLFFILMYGVPEEGGEALLVLLGALGGAWGTAMAYYFGSSRGSQIKDMRAMFPAERDK